MAEDGAEPTTVERRAAMTPDQVRGNPRAERLNRVFGIETEICVHVRLWASLVDQQGAAHKSGRGDRSGPTSANGCLADPKRAVGRCPQVTGGR